MAKETQPWKVMDGDEKSEFFERSFKEAGMEEIDPKYVIAWSKETGDPIFAVNPREMRFSWDPRYIDSAHVKKWIKETYKQVDREIRRETKGFGY